MGGTFLVYLVNDQGKKFYPHYIPSQKIYVLKETLHGAACFKSRSRAQEFIRVIGSSARDAQIEEMSVNEIEQTGLPVWTKLQEEANS